ncbi:499_t:CDS:2 [Entrophospora sp. SA101]|nr:499_t:CDS:2 [Entrophospora sp. SA101]
MELEYLQELNEQQKQAVYEKHHRVCVIAGPGCGKTKTLCGLVKVPTFNPEFWRIEDKNAAVEPLPLVPTVDFWCPGKESNLRPTG